MSNMTKEMNESGILIKPNLIINNQYSDDQTNETAKIVLDSKRIVNELEIHSVIKNRCIQTTV